MTILLRILNPKLQFVPFGKGKIHARWNGINANTGVDLAEITMCGRPITDEMRPLSEREMDAERICGNCYNSLRMYGPQVELVDSEVVGS